MFARLSKSLKNVSSSARVTPTVMMFLAVIGGGIWMFLTTYCDGTQEPVGGGMQSSVSVPSKKSGITRGVQKSGRLELIRTPLLPAGPTIVKSRLLYRNVSMSADCWRYLPSFPWNWTVEKLSGAPKGVTAMWTSV